MIQTLTNSDVGDERRQSWTQTSISCLKNKTTNKLTNKPGINWLRGASSESWPRVMSNAVANAVNCFDIDANLFVVCCEWSTYQPTYRQFARTETPSQWRSAERRLRARRARRRAQSRCARLQRPPRRSPALVQRVRVDAQLARASLTRSPVRSFALRRG